MAELYFAYGSNLNRRQFNIRCPGAKPIGRLTLPDFQLVFRGVADIIDSPGCTVEGAVYRITPRCEKALDRYEGFPVVYFKRTVPIEFTATGKPAMVIEVMFYAMHSDRISPPRTAYLQTIQAGYDDWSIPHDTLAAAVARARQAPAGSGRRQSLRAVAPRGSGVPQAGNE